MSLPSKCGLLAIRKVASRVTAFSHTSHTWLVRATRWWDNKDPCPRAGVVISSAEGWNWTPDCQRPVQEQAVCPLKASGDGKEAAHQAGCQRNKVFQLRAGQARSLPLWSLSDSCIKLQE